MHRSSILPRARGLAGIALLGASLGVLLAAGVVGSWLLPREAAAGPVTRQPTKKPAENPAPRPPGKPRAAGAIAGVVTLEGKPPARTPLERDTDPVCAKTPRLSEDVVATGGKLRDVHVRIQIRTAGTHAAPDAPAEITQHECMYTPRVVGIVEGQKVLIKNGDATYHNVRGAMGKRTLWNLGQPASAAPIVRSDLGKAGDVVSLHCDVHPWMRAWAVVTDHPYFDVTGDDGAFTLDDVPPGRYVVEAWHPVLGLKSAKIEVRAGETSKLSFVFE